MTGEGLATFAFPVDLASSLVVELGAIDCPRVSGKAKARKAVSSTNKTSVMMAGVA